MNAEPIILTFTRVKETKNMVKYDEDERAGQAPVLRNIYIAKWTQPSMKVKVVIQPAE